jgi:hypothetical protein
MTTMRCRKASRLSSTNIAKFAISALPRLTPAGNWPSPTKSKWYSAQDCFEGSLETGSQALAQASRTIRVKAATSLSCFLEAFDNQVKKYLKDHKELLSEYNRAMPVFPSKPLATLIRLLSNTRGGHLFSFMY